MPIFMDRHYTENATQNAIALAHEKDLMIQSDYNVKFLTYWFDEKRHTTFCLVEAPSMELIKTVHEKAHGDIPHEIIEVDPASVELFLGRIADPVVAHDEKPVEKIESAFRVICFTDLVGSTEMTNTLGHDKAMHLLRIHNAMTRSAIRKHNGTEVKHTGDGFMVSFNDANDAVNCAIEIQRSFDDYNQTHQQESLYVKIGISAGEPIEEDNDFFGTPVQLAARVCDRVKKEQIAITDLVKQELTQNTQDVNFNHQELCAFKGFRQQVPIYYIDWK